MGNRPIGVFDSGVGGITVLKRLIEKLPNENFVYLGDSKRFPYGEKTKNAIIEITKEGVEFLKSKDAKAIVIACGTATSQALDEVKQIEKSIPIIGVISPTVKYLKENNIKQIGVIATSGTIRSKGWEKSIESEIKNVHIQSKACPLLAPMVEEDWIDNKIVKLAIKEYLKGIKKVEVLILGCTHYPLLKKSIKKNLPRKTEIIDVGEHVANELQNTLNKMNLLNTQKQNGKLKIYFTDIKKTTKSTVKAILGEKIEVEKVEEKIKIKK